MAKVKAKAKAKAKATEMTRLVNSGWAEEMEAGLRADKSSLRIICPFITVEALNRLLVFKPDKIQVITRFNLNDFSVGVSDIGALRTLLDTGAEVRGVKRLHAKLYLLGRSRSIVTSTNLTTSGLDKNHELGLVTEDKQLIETCQTHFDDLWNSAGKNLEHGEPQKWKKRVDRHNKGRRYPDNRKPLEDFGTDVFNTQSPFVGTLTGTTDMPRAFVVFSGGNDGRMCLKAGILGQIKEFGWHWCVTYSKGRRPRQVGDGDIIFISRFTEKPNDIRIIGRAIGRKHVECRDDATRAEIADKSWRERWSHYIRLQDAEFIKGTLEGGISLNELMGELDSASFATTQRHAKLGKGNTNPRATYRQKPSVELSPEGFDWLNERLEAAFETHGKIIPKDTPDDFDWPDIKGVGKKVIG